MTGFSSRTGSWIIRCPAIPAAPWTSEFNGNAILLNGKLFPFLEVEPRRYRFRLFNTSNAGFFTVAFERGPQPGSGQEPFLMIGSDQGLLPSRSR